jgi:hypothetical protein
LSFNEQKAIQTLLTTEREKLFTPFSLAFDSTATCLFRVF